MRQFGHHSVIDAALAASIHINRLAEPPREPTQVPPGDLEDAVGDHDESDFNEDDTDDDLNEDDEDSQVRDDDDD